MKIFKRHKSAQKSAKPIRKKIIFISLALLTTLSVVSIIFFDAAPIRWLYYEYMAITNVVNCSDEVQFYVDEQVIYDDNALEGQITRIQDKAPGTKQECYSYREGKNSTKIISPATPSIVRVGTKRFKEPELLALAQPAGIRQSLDKEPVTIYYVDNYTDLVWADGKYSFAKKAITVKRSSTRDTQKTMLAHEYLHYVWYRDDLEKDTRLTSELTNFYNNSSDLKERMAKYTPQMTKPTEFFSYGCTEWSDGYLTPYIVEQCNKYIDRNKHRPFWIDTKKWAEAESRRLEAENRRQEAELDQKFKQLEEEYWRQEAEREKL